MGGIDVIMYIKDMRCRRILINELAILLFPQISLHAEGLKPSLTQGLP